MVGVDFQGVTRAEEDTEGDVAGFEAFHHGEAHVGAAAEFGLGPAAGLAFGADTVADVGEVVV